jgi:hypothetical protein
MASRFVADGPRPRYGWKTMAGLTTNESPLGGKVIPSATRTRHVYSDSSMGFAELR